MKNSLFTITLTGVFLLTPFLSKAELLIYKGTTKYNSVGNNNGARGSGKEFFIFDHDTAQGMTVRYNTFTGGYKAYEVSRITNLFILNVKGIKGKSFSALGYLRTPCAPDEEPKVEGIFGRGADSTLWVNTNATTFFPRTLTTGGYGVSFTESPDVYFLVQTNKVLSFNKTETIHSKSAGETLEQAVTGIITRLQSLGYLGPFGIEGPGQSIPMIPTSPRN